MTADPGTPTPAPAVAAPSEANFALRFYDDMSRKELRILREQCGCPNRDAWSHLVARPLAVDQIERKRALDGPEAGPSAARKRPLMAVLQASFVADRAVVAQRGKWGALL